MDKKEEVSRDYRTLVKRKMYYMGEELARDKEEINDIRG